MQILTLKQQKHSKMDNIVYIGMQPQNYTSMENIKAEQVRILFHWRTRMAKFGENYRGGREFVMCPLCLDHYDSQNLSFQCQVIKKKWNGNPEDVYSDNVKMETVKTIQQIMKIREEIFEKVKK